MSEYSASAQAGGKQRYVVSAWTAHTCMASQLVFLHGNMFSCIIHSYKCVHVHGKRTCKSRVIGYMLYMYLVTRLAGVIVAFLLGTLQEPFFLCVQRGDLRYLIELLTKDPEAVNTREEVFIIGACMFQVCGIYEACVGLNVITHFWGKRVEGQSMCY